MDFYMTERAKQMSDFITDAGRGNADRSLVAGDASNRKYERLTLGQKSLILMDAPPDKGEDVRPFIAIAEHLSSLGLSAPKIVSKDTEDGFLLLEDLGDALFARVMEQDPELEIPLYEAATDVLLELHKHPEPELAQYDCDAMLTMADMAFNWYFPAFGFDDVPRFEILNILKQLLTDHAPECDVLVQRDYHAENLIWLPDRSAPANVGLLDFQDARAGHRSYDLVSLLQDARRDVSTDIEKLMIQRYVNAAKIDLYAYQNAYHILGVQRNLRILGIFVRLCKKNGKPHYIDLIPRVLGYIHRSLEWSVLADLKTLLRPILDIPNNAALEGVKKS